jgi:hypothetical protein
LAPAPCETVGMADKPKRYVIDKDAKGNPVYGHCSKCGRIFQFENMLGGRHIEKAFEAHECKRDLQRITNQPAGKYQSAN